MDELKPASVTTVFIDDAATRLNCSRRTVYNYIRDGKLLTIKTRGGSQRVLVSSIDSLKLDRGDA